MLDRTADKPEFKYLELLGRVKVALQSARDVAVPAAEVRPYPDQPRTYFDEDAVRRLSESIDASGQTTAGMIRAVAHPDLGAHGHKYELIDGERRWRAVKLIPEERRPLYVARLIDADDDVVRYLISGIANFNREGHTPLETSDTIERLSGFDLPLREIAGLLGISEMWAGQMRSLQNLAPNVRSMLAPELPRSQRLPVTAAVEISKVAPKIQFGLAQRVLSRQVTLGGLRAEVVKTAKRAKVHVRERIVAPSDQWRSLTRKVAAMEAFAMDARRLSDIAEVRAYLAGRPAGERERLLVRLRRARDEAQRALDALEGKR